MAREDALWFAFAGVESGDMGVHVLRAPDVPVAEARGSAVEIPGRDGSLWLSDDAFRDVEIRIDVEIDGAAEIDEIAAWLQGSGDLTLSGAEDRCRRARLTGGFDLARGVHAYGPYRTTLAFACGPFQYEVNRRVLPAMTAPGLFAGDGSWFSRPVITVYGAGDVNLTVNGATVLFTGVDGHIALDCEAMLAHRDGVNASPQVTILSDDDAWPRLHPAGSVRNSVSWSGDVEKVVVEPRWRWR